ncbi:MAG TPA: TonB-dependent receptor, partial [Chryseosolibacter sp.]|nr:TonB-dependent receptor [Chryseosolibacter sp.]
MKRILIFILCIVVITQVSAQKLTQAVTGRVTDRTTGAVLAGAGIKLSGATGEFTAVASEQGIFTVSAPLGRYRLTVTFTGYQPVHDEVLLIAARQSVVNALLERGETVLETVEVQSATGVDEIPGLQSLSIEKTLRMPANFFDPVRVVTSYPAVVAANDQANAIIVRGNSPNSLAWRLNGLNIVNPNHLSNAGTLSDRPAANGGGVNIVSAQMLERTDFFFGAMPANYGNALAGIIDMQFRDGNRSDHNFTGQASLIGLDFAAEGPLTKSGNNSFLANYRYSTVGVLSAAGVDFGGERITFHDFSFHG